MGLLVSMGSMGLRKAGESVGGGMGRAGSKKRRRGDAGRGKRRGGPCYAGARCGCRRAFSACDCGENVRECVLVDGLMSLVADCALADGAKKKTRGRPFCGTGG